MIDLDIGKTAVYPKYIQDLRILLSLIGYLGCPFGPTPACL